MRGRRSIGRAVLAAVAFWAAGGPAVAGPISPFSESNLFAFGNLSVSAASVGGDTTAGGDLGMSGAGVTGNAYVGGDASVTAALIGGSLYAVGTATVTAASVGGTITQNGPPLLDFAALAAQLQATSAYLSGLPANGTAALGPLAGVLTGTDPVINVFNLPALPAGYDLTVVAPAGSTAIVNVAGTAVDLGSLNGGGTFDPTRLLFHFPDATSLDISGALVQGTLLAPQGNISFSGASLVGSAIGRDVSLFAASADPAPFAGVFPAPPAVPEPASLAVLALGAGGLAGWRRARRG